jgi:4-alpha-glucanotransferase
VYPEAALHILTSLGRKQDIEILLSIHKYEKRVDLDESTLHPSIRSWMNTWSYTSRMYLIENEASTVQKQRLIHLLESQDKDIIIRAFAFSLSFFFLSRNIIIDTKKARSYAEFMIAEYKDSLHKNLKTADTDLIFSEKEIESSRFFGL